jgi:hypothetical protein
MVEPEDTPATYGRLFEIFTLTRSLSSSSDIWALLHSNPERRRPPLFRVHSAEVGLDGDEAVLRLCIGLSKAMWMQGCPIHYCCFKTDVGLTRAQHEQPNQDSHSETIP